MQNIIDNKAFDNLEWRDIDSEQLDKALTRAEVLGVEPVRYDRDPDDFDGIIIYARSVNGDTFAAYIGNEPNAEMGVNPFLVQLAAIPLDADPGGRIAGISPEIKAQIAASIERWYNNLTRSEQISMGAIIHRSRSGR